MNNTILLCNVRGLNSFLKQKELSLESHRNKYGMMALLETKLNKDKLNACHDCHFSAWSSLDNCLRGARCRIWVLWRPDEYEVQLLAMDDQFIHMNVMMKAFLQRFTCTVIYASTMHLTDYVYGIKYRLWRFRTLSLLVVISTIY